MELIESVEEKTPVVNLENIAHVEQVYQSLRDASREKGGFSLGDVRAMHEAKETLTALFTSDEEGEFPKVEEKEIKALDVLMKCAQVQQTTGVFSFEGSLRILTSLEALNKALEDGKAPAQKIADMRKNLGASSHSSKQNLKSTKSGRSGKNKNSNQ